MANQADDHLKALSQDLLQALDDINGVHPGFRPAHAKGIMLLGVFTPSRDARSLTHAQHAERASTPVTVRFSNSAGIPDIPDNHPQGASPRGIAIRFHLGEHVHTDIIGHSHDGFPVRTPEEFLEFLRAVHASGPNAGKPTPVEAFLGGHPKALEFVLAPKPIPASFARESFFGVNAFRFTNHEGVSRYGRYRVIPEAGRQHLDSEAAAAKPPNFLFEEIVERIGKGAVQLRLAVQLAEEGDVVDDATEHWPENRTVVELGTIVLTSVVPDSDNEKKRIIFDPIPRTDGIEPSGDPLLEQRADLYLLSGRRRRAASSQSR
jgi:catalase